MQQVQVSVFDHSGFSEVHSFPTGMGLSLMEALKAAGYPIEAICGDWPSVLLVVWIGWKGLFRNLMMPN